MFIHFLNAESIVAILIGVMYDIFASILKGSRNRHCVKVIEVQWIHICAAR